MGGGGGGGRRGRGLQVAAVDTGLAAVLVQVVQQGVGVGDVQGLLLVHGLQTLLAGALLAHAVQDGVRETPPLAALRQLDVTWTKENDQAHTSGK